MSAIVLAAGEGTRMRSARPKPLHVICGRPMVMHVIEALADLDLARTVVVVGRDSERVVHEIGSRAAEWAATTFVEQPHQRGTGDAAAVGLASFDDDDLDDDSTVLVLPGDTPLLKRETIAGLVAEHEASGNAVTVLTSVLDDPAGYGRIVRSRGGQVTGIVEHRDADAAVRAIDEVNTGIYACRKHLLGPALRRISNSNAQGEYYLTDVVAVLASMGHRVGTMPADAAETAGVNDRWQLALAERELRARTNRMWLLAGVTMLDPRQTFIDVTVGIGRDVTLYPGVILQGATTIGDGCEIGPGCRLVDCVVGSNATVENTTARGATIGDRAVVGPFASLREGSTVGAGQHTGPFYTGTA